MLRSAVIAAVAAIILACGSSANAVPIVFTADLSGPNESPVNASPGIGSAEAVIDTSAHTLDVHVTFSGLVGLTTASHIHCCTVVPFAGIASVATEVPFFDSFPIGVTSGTYDHLFDLTVATSFNPAFVTAHGGTLALAETALFEGMLDGKSYLNIHTAAFPGGEIRGFLTPVPEPASLLVLGGSILAFALARRRRRSV